MSNDPTGNAAGASRAKQAAETNPLDFVPDKIPFGGVMNKSLTMRTGQTHVNRWTDDLLNRIGVGEIDPSFVITHHVKLDRGPQMYRTFRDKQDGCIKVVLTP